MEASDRIRPVVEWVIVKDGQLDAIPTAEELDRAYAFAVENDCVVKLKWSTKWQPNLPNKCYIYAECDIVLLKYDLRRLLSESLSNAFQY